MKKRVLKFYVFLILAVVVLGLLQLSSFGSLTGYTSFEDSSEWTFGKGFGIGFFGYEFKGDEVLVRYEIEDFDDRAGEVRIYYGFGDDMKSERVTLGAGENLKVVLKEDFSKRNAGENLKVVFDDGDELIKDEVKFVKNGVGISSYAVEGESNVEDSKFSVYGIIFVFLILVGFIFEFVYNNVLRKKSFVGHKLGKRMERNMIELDVS